MGLLHFGPGWLPERKEHSPPQRDAVSPHVFGSTCLSSLGFLCSNNSGMPFPLPPSHTGRSQTHKSSFPRVSPPCTIPGSRKPEGTAVSAVSHCCKCSSQGCSEDAEEEVCWVLNSGRSGAGRGCCSIHSAVWCTEASASGICRQLLQRAQSAAGSSAEPCRTRRWRGSLGEERGQLRQPREEGEVQLLARLCALPHVCSNPEGRHDNKLTVYLFPSLFPVFPTPPHEVALNPG